MTVKRFERGGSIPETAIIMMALMLFIFGVVDCGRALYTYSAVASLARQGARWAIVRGSQSCTNSNNQLSGCNASASDVANYVQSIAGPAIDKNSVHVTPTWTACGKAPACTVSVNVAYQFSLLGPISMAIPMSSTSQMVISQ
jgi:Flp pilus assembly protein TadG